MKGLGWTKDRRSLDLKKLQFAQSQKWVAGIGVVASLGIAFHVEAMKSSEFALEILALIVLFVRVFGCCWIGVLIWSFDSLIMADSVVPFRRFVLSTKVITPVVLTILTAVGSAGISGVLGVSVPSWISIATNSFMLFLLGGSFAHLADSMYTPGQNVYLYKKMSQERQFLFEDIQEKRIQVKLPPAIRGLLLLLGGEVFPLKTKRGDGELNEILENEDPSEFSSGDGFSISFLDVDEVVLEHRDSFLKLMKVAQVMNSDRYLWIILKKPRMVKRSSVKLIMNYDENEYVIEGLYIGGPSNPERKVEGGVERLLAALLEKN